MSYLKHRHGLKVIRQAQMNKSNIWLTLVSTVSQISKCHFMQTLTMLSIVVIVLYVISAMNTTQNLMQTLFRCITQARTVMVGIKSV